ncbi:MAG: prepilin-type N-terminal cleavage/methylation domain-containing protein [Candidatus Riflebacteria bacterium]|nr:prepilin-type N-terminal cleavage/methylation domain-containing protein [Candidatus Riflebacteria bacterium]
MIATSHISRNARGVTLVETMLAVTLLSLLFGAANSVLSYSRRETEKGFWIQQAISQLRNGTRAITDMLKKTSYPSTIIRTGSGAARNEKVISFKEKRTYDGEDAFGNLADKKGSGRLRDLELNSSDAFDMHSVITGSGIIRPSFKDQTIMYFPICEPEKDFEDGYTAGNITWVELLLRPERHYSTSGLASLILVERNETYNTKSDPYRRAFGLTNEFDRAIPVSREREIINDVNGIEVDSYAIDELRGVFVTQSGQKNEVTTKRILVSINVSCSHPKDGKIWLSDQCSVINNVELVTLAGTEYLELLQVFSAGPSGSAKVKYNNSELTVSVGGMVGTYKVSSINSDSKNESIGLKATDSDVERLLVKPVK